MFSGAELEPTRSFSAVELKRLQLRLEDHARRFRENRNRAFVLQQYLHRAHLAGRKLLLRYTCHVAAWVAFLPIELAAACEHEGSVSPALVLAKLLRKRGSGPLSARLSFALCLVRKRLDAINAPPITEAHSSPTNTDWEMLEKSMPRRHHLQRHAKPNAVAVSSTASNEAAQRLHWLNVAISRWGSASGTEREAKVKGLEELLRTLPDEATDAVARCLRKVLRYASAGLTQPRARPTCAGASTMSDTAAAELRLGANLQRRLRKLILRSLEQWRLRWDDEDQIHAMKAHALHLIHGFEASVGDLAAACAGSAWQRLKIGLHAGISADNVVTHPDRGRKRSNASARIFNEQNRGKKRHNEHASHKSVKGGMYTPNAKIQAVDLVQTVDDPMKLECTKCFHSIASKWVFVPNGKTKVLIPYNGHSGCGGLYLPPAGNAYIKDVFTILDYCHHNRTRSDCKLCGGTQVCTHGKRRRECALCRGEVQSDQKRLQISYIKKMSERDECG